ncbi:MAG TPA: hypothetical protein VGM38_09415 [Pseudolysinimonas sp.]|jgi:hypothetical protein
MAVENKTTVECPSCDGTGQFWQNGSPWRCNGCHGTGHLPIENQPANFQTTPSACGADRVTDEDIALREKNANLEALLSSMEKVITKDWPFRDAARVILDIFDPGEMSAEEQSACITLITYCRQRARRTVRLLECGKSA